MFRINYGDLLSNLLQEDIYRSLTDVERGALVDDAYYLTVNHLKGANFGSILSFFEKLCNETSYTPFTITVKHANTLWHLFSQKGLEVQYQVKCIIL